MIGIQEKSTEYWQQPTGEPLSEKTLAFCGALIKQNMEAIAAYRQEQAAPTEGEA